MADVPNKVLSWLYNVLGTDYVDASRTYSDVVETLSKYPSLSPRTEVYTYDNGASALLLLIRGTIPVQFRGATYRFPVDLWVPHAYPKEGIFGYVVPSSDMLVRPGQHVGSDGRIYHPYLAQWSKYWDKSSIADFISVLQGVFAKDPPVMAVEQTPSVTQIKSPPPVPPPPVEYRKTTQPATESTPAEEDRPPALPPKGASEVVNVSDKSQERPTIESRPPLPPLPPQFIGSQTRDSGPWQPSITHGAVHTSISTAPRETPRYPPQFGPAYPPGTSHFPPNPQTSNSPVSPIDSGQQSRLPQSATMASPEQYTPHYRQDSSIQGQPPFVQSMPPIYQSQPTAAPRPSAPVDLLSSPLESDVLSNQNTFVVAAPPIPPNPEKDALLQTLSQTLVSETQRILQSNKDAIVPLLAQRQAMQRAHDTLQSELDQLDQLDAILDNNERVIRGAMLEAEQVMREAAGRRRPEVDEVLVCPTAVGSQLYTLVAEEQACEDARVALGRGLDRGRVSLEVFVKQTRSLAREEFLKKALIRKIARGMGLDEKKW